MKAEASAAYMQESRKRPLVRCDSESISRKVEVLSSHAFCTQYDNELRKKWELFYKGYRNIYRRN